MNALWLSYGVVSIFVAGGAILRERPKCDYCDGTATSADRGFISPITPTPPLGFSAAN